MPRKLLWFSLAFPGVAYWLLWGGSLLLPIAIYAGFARRLARATGSSRRASAQPGRRDRRGRSRTLIWWFYLAGPVARALGDVLPF